MCHCIIFCKHMKQLSQKLCVVVSTGPASPPPLLSNMGISQKTGASRIDREKVLFLSFADFNQQKTDFIPCDSVAEKWFNKFSNRRNRSKRLHYCIAQVSSGSSRPHVVHTEIVHLAMVQTKMHHRSCTLKSEVISNAYSQHLNFES